MIPSDQNRLSAVGFFVKSAQEVEVLAQCLVWWVGCIEDVTGMEQTVDFLLSNQLQQILEEKPLDPAANRTVGEWYCLKKNRWEEGVTYLALGDQSEMKAISRLDLKLEKSPDDLLQLGDFCWELAEQRAGDREAL